jgi:hypothetical protein
MTIQTTEQMKRGTSQIEDINLIALYPTIYAKEALVLIRRLEFLKSFVQDVSIEHTAAMSDVATTDRVIDELQQILAEHLDATKSKFMFPYSNTNPKYDNHDDNDEDE